MKTNNLTWGLRKWFYRRFFNIKMSAERRIAPHTVEEFMSISEEERCVLLTPELFTDICTRIQSLEAKP